MTRLSKRTILIAALAGLLLVIALSFAAGRLTSRNDRGAWQAEQTDGERAGPAEQKNAQPESSIDDITDVNKRTFKLVGSSVNCSETEVDGNKSRNCSGTISIVPEGQTGIEPGLYKINEQTRLLRGGQQQDLNTLSQLSENNTAITLKLAEGSLDTLAEIRY